MIRLKRNICLGIVALLIVFLVTLKIQDTLYQKTLPEQQPEIESIKKEIGKIEITTNIDSSISSSIFNVSADVEDIEIITNKKNIYLFYGDGCPYCEREIEYLTELYPNYQEKINLYALEVWNDEDNKEFLEQASEYLNTQSDLVPTLIIGNQVIIGFSESQKEEIKEALSSTIELDIYKEIYK